MYKFSLEAGIDNVNLGPGEYGLLLSNNSAPYPLVKLQTEDRIEMLGTWDFLILHGWLREEREDYSNPKILAMRIVWKPADFIELGATRTILFGGDERPDYELSDYPDLISGEKENIPDDKFYNNSLNGYDILIGSRS